MNNIIIDTTNLKAYETLQEMAVAYNRPEEQITFLWDTLVKNEDLMNEFIYYLEHGTLNDKIKISGYSLTDLYVYQISNFNLYVSDIGKNTASCNKDILIFDTFVTMAKLINNPAETINKLNEGRGNDKGL